MVNKIFGAFLFQTNRMRNTLSVNVINKLNLIIL